MQNMDIIPDYEPEEDNDELEKNILASFLNNAQARQDIILNLHITDFLNPINRHLFSLMIDFYKKHNDIDEIGIIALIRDLSIPDANRLEAVIREISIRFPHYANILIYLEILEARSIKTKLNNFFKKEIESKIDYTNADFDFERIKTNLLEIIESRKSDELILINKFTKEFENKLEHIKQNKGKITGTAVGFRELDNITNGFQPGELIILAARPSIGKTALALNFVNNAAKTLNEKEAIVVFSLEMGADQLLERWICSEGMIPIKVFKSGKWSNEQEHSISMVNERISKLNVFLFDGSNLNILDIQAKLKQLSRDFKLKLVVIDYLQLVDGITNNKLINRNQEVAKISRTLKITAKELKTPIIAVAQLSRSIEQRQADDRKPKLSDLRESGAIEQDADIVAFLDYDRSEVDSDQSNKNNIRFLSNVVVELTIAKNRNGETGLVKLKFDKTMGKYIDL